MTFLREGDLNLPELIGRGGGRVVGDEVALAEVGEEFGEGLVGSISSQDLAAGFCGELKDVGPGEIGVAGFWILDGLGGLGVFGDYGVQNGIGG